MDRRNVLAGLAALATTPAFAAMRHAAAATKNPGGLAFMLGATHVALNIYARGEGLTFFAPHNTETTAVAAAHAVVDRHGGRVLWLSHPGARNISFIQSGVHYAFDPNRMFSDVGAQKSLELQSGHSSPEALAAVRDFAGKILFQILHPFPGKVIGIHNNENGYDIRNYLPGHHMAQDAAVPPSIVDPKNPGDFFFTTTSRLYELLSSKYNSVLQSPRADPDGSLSVWCEGNAMPYVNSEAHQGHLGQQKAMLEFVAGL